jgi:membrane protein DedA with SNARE-associated domain
LSFWLGRQYHREILLGWPLIRYPQFIGRSEAFINRYGVASVFLARFTAVVRAFVPLVAGILGMPWRQFYAANVLSALAWAPAHVFTWRAAWYGDQHRWRQRRAAYPPDNRRADRGIGRHLGNTLLLEPAFFASQGPEYCRLRSGRFR